METKLKQIEIITDQRSEQWHELRKGKFTGSEIWKLMANSRTKGEMSETTKSYILEKIAESVSVDSPESFTNQAMQWGVDNEALAKKWYQKTTGNKLREVGYIFLDGYEEYVGGSPDGCVVKENKLIEIKCPFNQGNHLKHILTHADDFKFDFKEYYWQMQFYMACIEAESCDFISFDPRITKDFGLHIKNIERNDEDIKSMIDRINEAIEYRIKIEAQLN